MPISHARRRAIAAGSLTAGGIFLFAAAAFHLFAASHIPEILARALEPRVYGFLEPIVSFTFLLNAVLLIPLAFSTLACAAGIRRGSAWPRWISLANALTVLALPVLIARTMGLRYFSDAPLFVAGAASVTVAGLVMLVPLLWAWRDIGAVAG